MSFAATSLSATIALFGELVEGCLPVRYNLRPFSGPTLDTKINLTFSPKDVL
jgi:hypothetical protein